VCRNTSPFVPCDGQKAGLEKQRDDVQESTIIGNHHGNHQGRQKSYGQYSRGSSQEYLATPPLPGDISKFVTVETDEYDAKRDSVDSLRPMPPPK
jgi:hypothetical protein